MNVLAYRQMQTYRGSFDLQHCTRIVAMNRLAEVGRVTPCAPSLPCRKAWLQESARRGLLALPFGLIQ